MIPRRAGHSGRSMVIGNRPTISRAQFLRAGDAKAQVTQQTVADGVNPPMHGQRLVLFPGLLDARGAAHVSYLLDDVEFA